MPHKEAGEIPIVDSLLSADWHSALSDKQITAYTRHAYIWRHTGAVSSSSAAQTSKNPKWDGGTDSYGVKFTSVWPRVTRMIRAVGADPGIWIAAHFSPCGYAKFISGKGSFDLPDISPSNLCSSASEGIHQEYCSKFPQITTDAYNAAGRAITLRLRSAQKLKIPEADQFLCVLSDESHVAATPFLRQGFANVLDVPEVITRYLRPAALEFEAKQRLYEGVIPVYLPAWLISNQLIEVVKAIRTYWTKYE